MGNVPQFFAEALRYNENRQLFNSTKGKENEQGATSRDLH